MKIFNNNQESNQESNQDDLKNENKSLKQQINLLKKYILESSIFNKMIQVELYERSEEVQKLQEENQEIDENEEIL